MRTITYRTGQEEILSRIPGLFAYTEINEDGTSVLHKATDAPLGCYGKVVENIQLPSNIELFNENDEPVLIKDEIYTYRTLISNYYKFKGSNVKGYSDFAEFMERGMGIIKVEYTEYNEKQHDLVPEYIYLSTVQEQYNELVKLKAKCDFYLARSAEMDDYEIDERTCCDCILFKRKGEKGMLNFLESHLKEADKIAEEYLKYVPNENSDDGKYQRLTLNYPINLFSTERDLGIVTPYYKDGLNVWSDLEDTVEIELTGQTSSRLQSLRMSKNYTNEYMEMEKPRNGHDWLYYYRIGYVKNQTVLYDELNNIQFMDRTGCPNFPNTETKATELVGQYVNNLWAFGDVIQNIERNENERTIKFTYWTDIHLKAKCVDYKINDDGKVLLYFDEFEPDYDFKDDVNSEYIKQYPEEVGSYHGMKFVETYYYDSDSEINELSEEEFFDYIFGYFDLDENKLNSSDTAAEQNLKKGQIGKCKIYEKFEFITYGSKITYPVTIGSNTVMVTVNSCDYYTKVVRSKESHSISCPNNDSKATCFPIIREEFYNGISYPADEKIDVDINRGTSSVFDRHLRFGEVKTFNDMIEYNNGSFFEMSV